MKLYLYWHLIVILLHLPFVQKIKVILVIKLIKHPNILLGQLIENYYIRRKSGSFYTTYAEDEPVASYILLCASYLKYFTSLGRSTNCECGELKRSAQIFLRQIRETVYE